MRKSLLCLLALLLVFSGVSLAAEEPLYNGDFSVMASGQDLPSGWFFDAWQDDVSQAYVQTGVSGENMIVVENHEDNDARACQRITVKPDTCYRITAEVMGFDISYGGGANISILGTFANSESVYDTETFETVTLTGITGKKQTEIVLALRIGGYGSLSSGAAMFKNVSMESLDNAPSDAISFEPAANNNSSDEKETVTATFGLMGIAFVSLIVAIAAVFIYLLIITKPRDLGEKKTTIAFAVAFAAAFLLRIVISTVFVGHSTDITCFIGWATRMAEVGPANFYRSGVFADYPPGYMYILWVIGLLKNFLGLTYGSPVFVLLLKLPSIAAEFFTAYLIYRIAEREKLTDAASWALFLLALFHPVFAFVSSGWGQIDSLLTLCLVGVLYLFLSDLRLPAGILYGLAILIKPQALMLGPLLAIAYLVPERKRKYLSTLLDAELSVLGAIMVIAVFVLPFSVGQGSNWLYEKYFSTVTSYAYASIEAFNLPALFGGNWRSIAEVPFLISYGAWGTIGIVISLAGTVALYIKGYKLYGKPALYLSAAFLFAALFTLGPYMHERYMYPTLIFLLIAAIYFDDKRLYASFVWLSAILFLNIACAYYIVDHQESRTQVYDNIVRIGSLLCVLGFGYFAYTCYNIIFRAKIEVSALKKKLSVNDNSVRETPLKLNEELPDKTLGLNKVPLFTRKDMLFCIGITAAYAIVALINLGSIKAPETEYHSNTPGTQVIIEFDEGQEITSAWIFPGIAQGTLLFEDDIESSYTQSYDDMFRWKVVPVSINSRYLYLTNYSGELRIREIAFFNSDGERVYPKAVTQEGFVLFDEPEVVPDQPSYYNGMYFDELYHGRTAYEHLNKIEPYENSHPPLGKIFIMLGIAAFGMNAFGWRIVGALFGIAMVPIFYAFAKRLFKKPEYALLSSVLFAFDFMHFTQTRLATIDVFAVFFIILMYYYMYQYYTMSFFDDGFKKTLRPLGLAGLFFGLGAATKWICIYAGIGLAVLLFMSLYSRYREYSTAMRSNNSTLRAKYGQLPKHLVNTLLWCCLFYIAVPVVIYIASYTPHFLLDSGYTLADVWANQKFMFSYHSGLTATHSFQSTWFEWPFTNRPMWYYSSSDVPAGMYSSITASGNPAVWWVCSIGAFALITYHMYNKLNHPQLPQEHGIATTLVAVASNFLPWVLISRCTFIYHYFATVPFIILCTVMLLYKMEEKFSGQKWIKYIKWVWMGVAVLLFLLMYPGISGFEIPIALAKTLRSLPGGGLFYGI